MDQFEALAHAIAKAAQTKVYSAEELAEKEAIQAARKHEAEQVLQRINNKLLNQRLCSHLRFDNTTHTVSVNDGEYLICQGCQHLIYPNAEPEVYNRHIQMGAPVGF